MLARGGIGGTARIGEVHAEAQDASRYAVEHERRTVRIGARHEAHVRRRPTGLIGEENEVAGRRAA